MSRRPCVREQVSHNIIFHRYRPGRKRRSREMSPSGPRLSDAYAACVAGQMRRVQGPAVFRHNRFNDIFFFSVFHYEPGERLAFIVENKFEQRFTVYNTHYQ